MVPPALAESPGPDAGHAHGRQGPDLGKGHGEEFVDEDRIEVVVPGPRAVPGLEEGNGFMEIVDDGGVEIEKHPGHGPGKFQGLLMGVAVVVVEDVLAPVGWRNRRQTVRNPFLPFEKSVKPVYGALSRPSGSETGLMRTISPLRIFLIIGCPKRRGDKPAP